MICHICKRRYYSVGYTCSRLSAMHACMYAAGLVILLFPNQL